MARRERRLTKREKKGIIGGGGTFEDRARALAKSAGVGEVGLGVDADGRPSMSEVLSEWAAPLLEPLLDADLTGYSRALSFVALVWNAATIRVAWGLP